MIGLIIFGSFFGGLFGIAFLELQNQKVDSADEVPTDLGLQVVGTLPILRAKANRGGGIGAGRRRRTATGKTSCSNRSTPPGPC